MFQSKVVEKIKTHFFIYSNFFSENCAIYEIMWKNMVEPDRPQMAIWHMCSACWISKGTDTHSEYEVLVAFQQQQWLHKCASMLRSYVLGLSRLHFSIHKVFPFLLTLCFLMQIFSLQPVLRHLQAVLFSYCE